MTPKPFNVTLPSGGSGTGISYWKNWYQCPRRAGLDEQARSEGEPTSGDSNATLLGTYFHAYMELYHKLKKPGFDTGLVRFASRGSSTTSEATLQKKAEELFHWYRVDHPPSYFGQVLEVEQRFEMPFTEDRPEWAPSSMPLTAKMDLEVLMTPTAAKRLRREHRLAVQPGKVYIVDHKTAGEDRWSLGSMYSCELQFAFYQMMFLALRKLHGKGKLAGLLVNTVIKEKPHKQRVFRIPLPTKNTTEMISRFLHTAWDNYMADTNTANPMVCHDWGKVCQYLKANACQRF